jgi:DNA helicase HerA-like ATPase
MTEILIGSNEETSVSLDPRYGNRHGMIAGATGTGKSVSLMVLAEGFSKLGVPCFLADAKGDLAGLSLAAGEPGDKLKARLAKLHLNDWKPQANPVIFWDIYGKLGHPVRATISEMGPTLLGRILELNDTQEGVLEVIFKVADDQGWLLLDLSDLRALLGFASENAKDISTHYGLISTQSIAAIQRAVLKLEQDGADQFFGEPALELADLMRQDMSGRGVINVLAADQLILKPRLYSTFLLWLLSELFEQLPEVGDLDQPKLVFFFDEAHLLFDDAPPALLQRVEQVVRLIRSKGVGVYFVTQNPLDVPDKVLGQLGNRVQHALRAFTPRDQKAVRAAAETFRPNPELDTAKVIMELGKGEALVSFLEGNGVPTPVERALIRPPAARIGPLTEAERKAVLEASPVKGKYDKTIDRESAFEMLQKGLPQEGAAEEEKEAGEASQAGGGGFWTMLTAILAIIFGTNRKRGQRLSAGQAMARDITRTVSNRVAGQIAADIGKSLGGATGSQVGRAIVRGALGGMLRR